MEFKEVDFKTIEKKWQNKWEEEEIFQVLNLEKQYRFFFEDVELYGWEVCLYPIRRPLFSQRLGEDHE